MDQNKSYSIVEADAAQREYIFENRYRIQKYREFHHIFAALEKSSGEIIGFITGRPREDVPESWFIASLWVNPEYRRQGIGRALFLELRHRAEEKGARDMGGFANPTEASTMFWDSLGFCFSKTGKPKVADEWNESGFGNYSHIMFSNVNECVYEEKSISIPARIGRAKREDLVYICEKYLIPSNEKYYSQHKDELFGFAAFNNDNRIVGYVMMRYEMMFPPLDGIMIQGTVYVEPEMRRNGIGSALVCEAVKTAKEKGVKQILFGGKDDFLPFWKSLGLQWHRWGRSTDEPEKYAVLAGLRL